MISFLEMFGGADSPTMTVAKSSVRNCPNEQTADVSQNRLSHYAAALAQVDDDEPCFFTRMGEIQAEGWLA